MFDGRKGPVGDTGPAGVRGMPGPYCARDEVELIAHLIGVLEKADYYGERTGYVDGENPKIAVDSFALKQALDALKNYEALLCQPIYELVAPGFFHVQRPAKSVKGIW